MYFLVMVMVIEIYSALYFTVARSAEGRPSGWPHGFSVSAFLAPFSGQWEVAAALKILIQASMFIIQIYNPRIVKHPFPVITYSEIFSGYVLTFVLSHRGFPL